MKPKRPKCNPWVEGFKASDFKSKRKFGVKVNRPKPKFVVGQVVAYKHPRIGTVYQTVSDVQSPPSWFGSIEWHYHLSDYIGGWVGPIPESDLRPLTAREKGETRKVYGKKT